MISDTKLRRKVQFAFASIATALLIAALLLPQATETLLTIELVFLVVGAFIISKPRRWTRDQR